MARASTGPAEAPNACNRRHRIRPSALPDRAQPTDPAMNSTRPAIIGPAPADAVADRPPRRAGPG